VIVADTGAVVALIDADERHHRVLRELYESDPEAWRVPWAILPEVDYLLATRVGARAQEAFLADLAAGLYLVEWGDESDLREAQRICRRHRALAPGLIDAVVIAIAERLRADAIATLDLRHFGAIRIKGDPKLFPRDL
jgi:predicted nucleic acid-binding protein